MRSNRSSCSRGESAKTHAYSPKILTRRAAFLLLLLQACGDGDGPGVGNTPDKPTPARNTEQDETPQAADPAPQSADESAQVVEAEPEMAPLAAESAVQELLTDDWPGYRVGLKHPPVYDLGEIGVVDASGNALKPGRPLRKMPPHSEHALIAFSGSHLYLIDNQPTEELSAFVAQERAKQVAAMLAQLPDTASEDVIQKGRSGTGELGETRQQLVILDPRDDRKELSIRKGWGIDSWFKAIGGLAKYEDQNHNPTPDSIPIGTGTLVGPNAVLTNAHVVFDRDAAGGLKLLALAFHPRMDGSGTVDGVSPYGAWRLNGQVDVINNKLVYGEFPAVFLERDCLRENITDTKLLELCNANDWVVIATTRVGMTPSLQYMDPQYVATKDLTTLKNRGYPLCSASSQDSPPPDPCQPRTLYGSEKYCKVTGSYGATEGGVYTLATHDCDASEGMSGSPIYKYVGQGATIAAIHVGTFRPGLGLQLKNVARRVTTRMAETIHSFVLTKGL